MTAKTNQGTHKAGSDLFSQSIKIDSLELSVRELFSHVAIFGQTGSGKTRFALLPIVESLLRAFSDRDELKPGMLIFDSKGDMAEHLHKCLAAVGREADLLVIGPGESTYVPLFQRYAGNPREAALYLVALGETSSNADGKKGENAMYWLDSVARYLEAVLILAKAAEGESFGGMKGISAALTHADALLLEDEDDENDERNSWQEKRVGEAIRALDDGVIKGTIDHAEYRVVRDTLQHEFREIGDRTLGIIKQYAHNFRSVRE